MTKKLGAVVAKKSGKGSVQVKPFQVSVLSVQVKPFQVKILIAILVGFKNFLIVYLSQKYFW